jgi:hypothetical protein
MTTENTGGLGAFLGLTTLWGLAFAALSLWATIIYFLNYFNLRAVRRECEAMKDAMEVQVQLTGRLLAALAPATMPPPQVGQSGS